jgi:hypothetical protein
VSSDKRDNPWGLTVHQCACIEAYIETASQKGAARLTGYSVRAIEKSMIGARRKMGLKDMFHVYIWYDRWKRSEE